MSLLKTPWFTLVELQVAANTTSQWVNFPDQPDLTTLQDQIVFIHGIELIPFTVLATAPSGSTNAALAELVKATLVLVNDDKKRVYQYPVLGLNRVYSEDAGALIPHVNDLQLFDDLSKIAWTKSGIQFTVPPANAPYSILFGVHYSKRTTEATR